MMPDPYLVDSGLSQPITVEGHELQIEIYSLEGEPKWSLEVIDEDATSSVWDDLFDSDQEALDEALRVIGEEGLSAFRDGENIVRLPLH